MILIKGIMKKNKCELESLIEYWNFKSKIHSIIGISLLVVILISFGLSILFFYNQYENILYLNPNIDKKIYLITLSFMASFIFYALKLLIRLFFHQMSIWSGSRNKVVIGEIYINCKDRFSEQEYYDLFQIIFTSDQEMSLENIDTTNNSSLLSKLK